MSIKSLILGSATVALAATGAQAADAIVIAEPEPVEYVRVCDVYGAGYFYIPGTETCLRISGWVRHQYDGVAGGNVTDRGVNSAGVLLPGASVPAAGDYPALNPGAVNPNRVRNRTRGPNVYTGAQINLDARSETEYGTLRGWVQLETPSSSSAVHNGVNSFHPRDLGIVVNRALIQLGGLYMGYADSLFSSSSNFGGSSLGNYGGFTYADTFGYHYEQRHQIGYQFDGGNGFWGAVAIEHDDTGSISATTTNVNYAPDVVGKIAYQQAWGGVWLGAGYDESAKGVGIRGGVQAVFSPLTVRLDGYYQSKAAVSYGRGARWALQGTALYQINPTLGIAAGVEYRADLVANGRGIQRAAQSVGLGVNSLLNVPTTDTSYFADNSHAWTAQLGLNWQPVQNFQIGADVVYSKLKISEVNALGDRFTRNDDATSFRLRFQRNF